MATGHNFAQVRVGEVMAFLDSWGAGLFMIRVDGKRIFFEDSDRFGPVVLRSSDLEPARRQPGERARFWGAHAMWRKAGRPTRGRGRVKVAVWREPRPGTYWKDEATGLSHFLTEPDLPDGPYRRVAQPNPDTPPA